MARAVWRDKLKTLAGIGLTAALLIAGAGASDKLLAQERPVVRAAESFDGGEDIEELQCNMYKRHVRFVSPPAQGMTFTAGIPIRVFGSCWDGASYKVNDEGTPKVECFLDGKSCGTVASKHTPRDYYEYFLKDVPVGRHVLVLKATYTLGKGNESAPLSLMVEDPPARAGTVKLAGDMVLKGGQDLKWEDATVVGGGFRVLSEPGWTGSVVIRNCRISGLGSVSAPGIELKTTSGGILVQDSVFEGSGTIRLAAEGKGDFILRNNEFRPNNVIRVWSPEPSQSPMVVLTGNPSGKKLFQGNRMGIGWVAFESGSGWLIGGDNDDDVNVVLGVRGGIRMWNCRDSIIRGNYSVPKLGAGWSQGTNFAFESCSGLLCEHNVIGATAWPLQGFGGEFRYNVIVGSGHEWVRILTTGTKLHHNLFLNGCGQWVDGIWIYTGSKDVAVYNNTFDGGAPRLKDVTTIVTSPMLKADAGNNFSSVRNNVFTGNLPMPNGALPPIVAGGPGCVAYADYNCFFNPLAPKMPGYAEGVAAGNPGVHAGRPGQVSFKAAGPLLQISLGTADFGGSMYGGSAG